ncbi:CD225/dispanin family protein [Saccharopolyspora cebuensis]|uniref:CD225/dispanin family protein n=1 Tax=Saccharopolyspora cebuensis TaxID=418759 RepID=A0ABV4CE52_9PSEU
MSEPTDDRSAEGASPVPEGPVGPAQAPAPPPGGYLPPQAWGGWPVPPNNNLGWAIGGLLVCWPFGIPSLIKATQVTTLWAQGRFGEAQAAASEAKKWGKIGIIVGACLWGLYLVLMVVYFVFLAGLVGGAITSGQP